MTVVALALVVCLAATVICGAGLVRSQSRAHARREDLLLNQLLHAVGKPWTPAPAEAPAAPAETPDRLPVEWTSSPEHFPK